MENIHLKSISPADLGEVTLLVGDPGRVELISNSWENTRLLLKNREFILVAGTWKGKNVSICSTGIGLGSTEIAVIELIQSGAKKLVRLGGCGTWRKDLAPGDIMLNHAMARNHGVLSEYVSDVYPAVADFDLLQKIKSNVTSVGFHVHTGIGMTTQSYYLGQGRDHAITNGPKPDSSFMNYWQDRHITNFEMETAVLYLLAALYQIPAANCLVIHVNRFNDQWVSDDNYKVLHAKAAKAILNACIH
ncbi:nucleoside phosphorylase [Virgibacillus sp. NKC19-3]|uniref:nucleoside phosphorylase n=1 Tax=Virgibacillus saliphilus TaxID=2831674 RepID=UPI001C9AEE07|nr:nucleoside phosphorylase [Virgibacillus sp. NKC19-3]MBY7142918.1 nucleoside phosphorylase [Virgibacillus sp. NKC19-3]